MRTWSHIRSAFRLTLLFLFFQAVGLSGDPVPVHPKEPTAAIAFQSEPPDSDFPSPLSFLFAAVLPADLPVPTGPPACCLLQVQRDSPRPVGKIDRLAFSGLSPPRHRS